MKAPKWAVCLGVIWLATAAVAWAQTDEPEDTEQKIINVAATASDEAVQGRIQTILTASGWFNDLNITNNSGIVTITGTTAKESHKQWAENIAARTENAVAVVNKLKVVNPNPWSLAPLANQTHTLFESALRYLPLWAIALVIFVLSVFFAKKLAAFARRLLERRIDSVMLRHLVARLLAIPVLVIGIYLVFSVSGLGSLATTLIGGTGLIGLIIGIAFRDITENFLASVLLSIQRPFVLGDMIQVMNFTGMVEAMTTRGTVLMTLDGNHVQIPNTIIYKEPITNFTANPNTRQSFTVGIGYDASISEVQSLVLSWLDQHPAVLKDPEPLILAEQLAASTVNIGIYFWVDTRSHSVLKVRSSVIRTVKFKLMEAGVPMPDDAREIIFPQGIAVSVNNNDLPQPPQSAPPIDARDARLATKAEGQLVSDEGMLKAQASHSKLGEHKTNLLKS